MKEKLWPHGRVYCHYDQFSHNVLHNCILRSTMEALSSDPGLDKELSQDLTASLRWFADVDLVHLTPSIFRKVQLHRNNAVYGFLMDVCRLVMEQLLVSERLGESLFRDFYRNDQAMRVLFEQFVRNFYALELTDCHVYAKKLNWAGEVTNPESAAVLPGMVTDVTIEGTDRAIILDTKYTPKALADAYWGDGAHLRTEHLYQIYAYVRNAEALGSKWQDCEGILLYPSVGETLRYDYEFGAHPMRIRSVDLAANWSSIREELLCIAHDGLQVT
ncbi:MAG: hypothetical protein HOC20_07170 [Chloroflexi bacterium]|nr:hypothetical protein [Chloroflexota bacterium]